MDTHTSHPDLDRHGPLVLGTLRAARGGSGRLITVSLLLGLSLAGVLAAGATALGRAATPDMPQTWTWLFLVFTAIVGLMVVVFAGSYLWAKRADS